MSLDCSILFIYFFNRPCFLSEVPLHFLVFDMFGEELASTDPQKNNPGVLSDAQQSF